MLPKQTSNPRIFIVCGVSGTGKSTIGKLLADQLNTEFYEGDNYHSPENVERMSQGIPLNDELRKEWLITLRDLIHGNLTKGNTCVLACSAIKQKYRDVLRKSDSRVHFIAIDGSYELILERMKSRQGHYFKPDLLETQFAEWEPLNKGITIPSTLSPVEIVEKITEEL